jgi:hypothetical protein
MEKQIEHLNIQHDHQCGSISTTPIQGLGIEWEYQANNSFFYLQNNLL